MKDSINKKIEKINNLKIDNTEIVSVYYEDSGICEEYENLPPFYRVVLKSSYGAGSLINTEVWLPDMWNSVFVGLGNGGIAGKICYGALATHLKRGYAVANTDMGTFNGRERGINNPDVWKDFGWRATHSMTLAGKEIILNHYGELPDYSYFVGGSTGGQQAYAMAQRFPRDYDGIVAGVPANNRVFLHTYFLWNHINLKKPDGSVMFSEFEIEKITDSANKFFQNLGDGTVGDNFISYPKNDKETVDSFIEYLKNKCQGFTNEQLYALKKVYMGPVNLASGKQIYNGMPIGSERFGCGIKACQEEESPHFYPFIWAFGKEYNGTDFDFNEDLEKVSDLLSGDLNANDPDLSDFEKNEGKLIAFSGSCDPCVPFADAVNYYARVCNKMGGYDRVSKFFKYFLMPGKDHGEGGFGTKLIALDECGNIDLLEAVRLWRETGQAPEYLYGLRKDEENKVSFVRKVYPFGDNNSLTDNDLVACDDDYLNR